MATPAADSDSARGAALAASSGHADVAPETIVEAPTLRKASGFIIFALVCVALVVIATQAGWFSEDRLEIWRTWIGGLGAWGPVAFVILNALAVAVGVPRTFFAAAGGALFGFLSGMLLAQYGALLGSLITFFVGRALGRATIAPWVIQRFPKSRAVFDTVERHGFAANVLLRWAPVGHSFTSNLLMAVSRVSPLDFILGTFVGLLPYSIVFALLGSAAVGGNSILRVAGAILSSITLTVVLGWWIRRRRAKAKTA